MALYEYRCRQCKHIQEERHGMSEKPEVTCKECGSTDTFKYLGNSRITPQFKGTGFYSTDRMVSAYNIPKPQQEQAKKRGLL